MPFEAMKLTTPSLSAYAAFQCFELSFCLVGTRAPAAQVGLGLRQALLCAGLEPRSRDWRALGPRRGTMRAARAAAPLLNAESELGREAIRASSHACDESTGFADR